jgi:hypothetical protein
MSIERSSNGDGQAGMGLRDGVNKARKVAFQMHPEGKEVGDDQNLRDAFRQKCGDSAFERRLAEFEEGSFYVRKIAGVGKVGGYGAHGLVGGLDAGTVGEDDDAGDHGTACDHCSVELDGTKPIPCK